MDSEQTPYTPREKQPRKVCNRCSKEWAITQFHWSNKAKNRRIGFCKECKRAEDRTRKKNPHRKRSPNDKLHARRSNLWRNYKITLEQYDEMFKAQQGVCAICYKPEDTRYILAVDHDHDTGKVRSLLCRKCNTGIGALCDNPQLLHAAADYLVRHGKGKAA